MRPRRRRSMPAQAIIAALSVHSRSGGATSRQPRLPPEPQAGRAGRRWRRRRRRRPASAGSRAGRGRRPAHCGCDRPAHRRPPPGTRRRGRRWRRAVRRRCRQPLGRVPHRRLQPREGEVTARPAQHRPRQGEAAGIARACRPLHRRPAGIAQAQHLRHLVEGLAQRVVDGRAQPPVAADAFDHQQLAVAAGDQQQQVGKGDAVGQPRRQRVPFQVVDGEERQAGGRRRSPWRSSRRR